MIIQDDSLMVPSAAPPASLLDWSRIDTVMFDMDGTLLDLAFDNFFWQEAVPSAWASQNAASLEQAKSTLAPQFADEEGTLNWYSLSFWSDALDMDLAALKERYRDRIALRPHVHETLNALRQADKRLWLVTNAHPIVLDIKLERSQLTPFFEAVISSHDLGFAKEQDAFWQTLQRDYEFEPEHSVLIDDSIAVLDAAKRYGIGSTLMISQPDSLKVPRLHAAYPLVHDLRHLAAGLV